ncbi:MAG: hypothetical protein AAFO15_02730, partial [Pseudomonadota bacterium]
NISTVATQEEMPDMLLFMMGNVDNGGIELVSDVAGVSIEKEFDGISTWSGKCNFNMGGTYEEDFSKCIGRQITNFEHYLEEEN